ncbi:hypothetical protein D3C72_257560 [compost metagenome]
MLTRALGDTNEDAARGKLGACSQAVRSAFLAMDGVLDRAVTDLTTRPLQRGGEWYARSYRHDGALVCELHPKGEWIKVKIDKTAFVRAPRALLPVGETRTGWLGIAPEEAPAAVRFLANLIAR